jgi:hypothetical protein
MLPSMYVPLEILDLPHFPPGMLPTLHYPSGLQTQRTAWLQTSATLDLAPQTSVPTASLPRDVGADFAQNREVSFTDASPITGVDEVDLVLDEDEMFELGDDDRLPGSPSVKCFF